MKSIVLIKCIRVRVGKVRYLLCFKDTATTENYTLYLNDALPMPVMDGITAVRHIMSSNPVPILMFSSLTHDGAQATLDALEAGAVDFLPKRFEDIAKDRRAHV